MPNRRIFTGGQWATALGIALGLHILLAWSLLSSLPVLSRTPAGQGGRLAVETLSLNGVEAPLLSNLAAESLELAMVTPPTTALQAIAPPDVRPMTEVVPIEQTPSRNEKAKPKVNPKKRATRPRKGKANKAAKGSKNTDWAGTRSLSDLERAIQLR